MSDYFKLAMKRRAMKLVEQAQQGELDYVSFIKQAAKSGVSDDPDVHNYALILRENQLQKRSAGKQSEITGAVGRAMQPQPVLQGQDLSNRAGAAATMDPEQYFAASQQPGVPSPAATAPIETEEQFSAAMGRQQLSPEIDTSDIASNPAYAFAQGALGSEQDELARARLKVQQDAEAEDEADRQTTRSGRFAHETAGPGTCVEILQRRRERSKPEFENADNWTSWLRRRTRITANPSQ
jgi:hypothetical protein